MHNACCRERDHLVQASLEASCCDCGSRIILYHVIFLVMSWFGRLRAVAMSRLALCAVAGFLWDRERITDEEVLR